MAPRIATLLALPLLIAGAGALCATTPLQATMRTWNANAMTIGQMVAGAHALDKVEATQLLKGFIVDAQAIASRTKEADPGATDLKSRFEGFAADAQLTIQAIRANDKVSDRYSQLRADCGACHDLYAD
jgi:cytochrome c556